MLFHSFCLIDIYVFFFLKHYEGYLINCLLTMIFWVFHERLDLLFHEKVVIIKDFLNFKEFYSDIFSFEILENVQKTHFLFPRSMKFSVANVIVRPLKKGRNFVFGCVLVFLLSSQNQIPQEIIGLGWVIYHIKALTVVIRTTIKNFKKLFSVSRKTGLKFLIFRLISSE